MTCRRGPPTRFLLGTRKKSWVLSGRYAWLTHTLLFQPSHPLALITCASSRCCQVSLFLAIPSTRSCCACVYFWRHRRRPAPSMTSFPAHRPPPSNHHSPKHNLLLRRFTLKCTASAKMRRHLRLSTSHHRTCHLALAAAVSCVGATVSTRLLHKH